MPKSTWNEIEIRPKSWKMMPWAPRAAFGAPVGARSATQVDRAPDNVAILIKSGHVLGAKGPPLKISGGPKVAKGIKYGDFLENH